MQFNNYPFFFTSKSLNILHSIIYIVVVVIVETVDKAQD